MKELHKARSLIQQTSDRATFVKILRALATAYVEEGDAKRAGFALLHAMAVGGTSNYLEGQALILIEAGRLQLLRGNPDDALPLLERGLDQGMTYLSESEQLRVSINLVQALRGARRFQNAMARLETINLPVAATRLRFLTELERARIACGLGDRDEVHAALKRAAELAPESQHSFERVELMEVKIELASAENGQALVEAMLSEAESILADPVEQQNVDPIALAVRARALAKLGRLDEADKAVEGLESHGFVDLANLARAEATWQRRIRNN